VDFAKNEAHRGVSVAEAVITAVKDATLHQSFFIPMITIDWLGLVLAPVRTLHRIENPAK
jgi:hypothetical protein